MDRETKLHVLLLIVPNFLTVIITVIYSLGVWPCFQLITVNAICVSFMALELAQSIKENLNVWKTCGFISAGAIAGILAGFNVSNDIKDQMFSLDQLSFWGGLWIGLLIVSVISALVLLIRMLCWDQNQWENIRKLRQEYRKECIEIVWKLQQLKQINKLKLSAEKSTAKIEKQRDQVAKYFTIRNIKHEQRLKFLNDWRKYWENITSVLAHRVKYLALFIVSSSIAFLFLVIPYSTKFQDIIFNWADAVTNLATKIGITSNDPDKFSSALASYVIFYLFCIIAIGLIIFLCRYIYKILIKRQTKNTEMIEETKNTEMIEGKKNILVEYDTAIAILTVFTALLLALGTNDLSSILDIANTWTILITVILLILIVFVSIEIVRIVVEQIGQKNSLLKQLVHLIFVVILEFLTGLFVEIIINFQIEKVISSLFTIIFPQEELSFTSKVQKEFNNMFNKEMSSSKKDGNTGYTQPYFLKKYIWRRYHKK